MATNFQNDSSRWPGQPNYIKITELQPSGKKRMSAEQYLRGAASDLTTGTILGE